jgi:hypothetical protein
MLRRGRSELVRNRNHKTTAVGLDLSRFDDDDSMRVASDSGLLFHGIRLTREKAMPRIRETELPPTKSCGSRLSPAIFLAVWRVRVKYRDE